MSCMQKIPSARYLYLFWEMFIIFLHYHKKTLSKKCLLSSFFPNIYIYKYILNVGARFIRLRKQRRDTRMRRSLIFALVVTQLIVLNWNKYSRCILLFTDLFVKSGILFFFLMETNFIIFMKIWNVNFILN